MEKSMEGEKAKAQTHFELRYSHQEYGKKTDLFVGGQFAIAVALTPILAKYLISLISK